MHKIKILIMIIGSMSLSAYSMSRIGARIIGQRIAQSFKSPAIALPRSCGRPIAHVPKKFMPKVVAASSFGAITIQQAVADQSQTIEIHKNGITITDSSGIQRNEKGEIITATSGLKREDLKGMQPLQIEIIPSEPWENNFIPTCLGAGAGFIGGAVISMLIVGQLLRDRSINQLQAQQGISWVSLLGGLGGGISGYKKNSNKIKEWEKYKQQLKKEKKEQLKSKDNEMSPSKTAKAVSRSRIKGRGIGNLFGYYDDYIYLPKTY